MLFYSQKEGIVKQDSQVLDSSSYSGHGVGVNNPASQELVGIGPIPCGIYDIMDSHTSPKSGPLTMNLVPRSGTEVFGRSGFEWHGDERENVGKELASHGCIISCIKTRRIVANLDRSLRTITVVPSFGLSSNIPIGGKNTEGQLSKQTDHTSPSLPPPSGIGPVHSPLQNPDLLPSSKPNNDAIPGQNAEKIHEVPQPGENITGRVF
jgi:hypothetical protein